jgi:Zn-dependent peptidase ImmA (M78 family)/DNA-binding XRE family transcriptional regulator
MQQKLFSPNALTEGRLARGLNKAQLAAAIGISRQAMSLIEKGENDPKLETLTKIADVLHLPQRFFFREPRPGFVLESPIFYRDLYKTTDLVRAEAITKAKWHYCGYLELTKHLKRIPRNLKMFCFEESFDFSAIVPDQIEEYAKQLRGFWGLGLGPILGLVPLVESNGVVVFQIDMQPDINGFSFFADGKIPFIAVARKVSAGRNRFNLAHELAHLLLHAMLDEKELAEHHNQLEVQAHRFAAAFLFPRERFLDEFVSTDLNYLLMLKQRWGMSITAMVRRAVDLDMISDDEAVSFYRKHLGIRKREPGDEEMIVERPTFPQNGLKAVLNANRISIDDLKHELPYDTNDLAEIFYTDAGIFEPGDPSGADVVNKIIQFKPRV